MSSKNIETEHFKILNLNDDKCIPIWLSPITKCFVTFYSIQTLVGYLMPNSEYIYLHTSRNTCHWLGSERALKNYTLIYESYCFDIIECFGAEYLQALIARLQPKTNLVKYTIEFNTRLS